jgi:hypothetical protein
MESLETGGQIVVEVPSHEMFQSLPIEVDFEDQLHIRQENSQDLHAVLSQDSQQH